MGPVLSTHTHTHAHTHIHTHMFLLVPEHSRKMW